MADVIELEVGDLPGDGNLELPCLGEGQGGRYEGGEDRAEHCEEIGIGAEDQRSLGL